MIPPVLSTLALIGPALFLIHRTLDRGRLAYGDSSAAALIRPRVGEY
jgi:hypothetical protein